MRDFKKQFKKLSICISLLLALFCFDAEVSADVFAGLGGGEDKVPLTSRVLTGNLPNGLKYYILENSLPANRAHLALVVNAGSALERDDERGFAHFVEHLAFNDTKRFPKLELIEYLRSVGTRFGADVNAYTSYDETVYYFDVPVETKDGVKRVPDRALAILDDWTHAVSFNSEDVESEKLVVLEELRTRLGAMERARKITLPILFSGSAYENRDPIGLIEIIENASAPRLKSFYDSWYSSDNMALVFVGDFNGRALEAELASHFNMPPSSKPVNRPRYELPSPVDGNFRVEVIKDPELTASNFVIYYKRDMGEGRGTIAYYRASIIDFLISVMFNARFGEAALKPESSATDYWADTFQWSENSRYYVIGVSPKTGNSREALMELLLEKEEARGFGFSESELLRAKLTLGSYMEKQLSEKDRRESRFFIRGFTNNFLYGEDMADIEWEVNAVNSMLPLITLDEIHAVVNEYFAANDCTVFLTAPKAEEESLPDAEGIKSIFAAASGAVIVPRVEVAVTDALLESEPDAGSVVSLKTDPATDSVMLTMSNGAKIILKKTANRNNEIVLYALAKGGTTNAPLEHIVSAGLAAQMVIASGLGPYSRIELVNKLAGKQASFSFWVSNYYRGFQGASTMGDIKTLFQMLHLFFKDPGLDARAVAATLDQLRTNLIHQNDDPQSVFSRELTKTIYNNHPLFKPIELEDIQLVSMDHLNSFLSRCLNPRDYTFVFTGNIDIDEIRILAEKYIASIPGGQSMNQWIDPGVTRPAGSEKIIYKGQDERSIVYLCYFAKGADEFSEEKNQIAAILSECLDITLTDEIREKLGGVYSISSSASTMVIPKGESQLSVYFQCDPARANELIAAVKDRITEIAGGKLKQDTFDKAKEALLIQHENQIQRNLYIAQSYANSAALYDTPLSRLYQRPDVIRKITMEDIQSFCRVLLDADPALVVLYPENW